MRKRKRPSVLDYIWKYEIALRKSEYYENTHSPLRKILGVYWKCVKHILGVKCGFSIPNNTCGKGLTLVHYGPVIINANARLGDYCRIHVGVNIGQDARNGETPVIGHHAFIGPGAKIFGGINIGNWVAIGSNAVVNKSFEGDNISIAGIPAKIVSNKGAVGIIDDLGRPL